MVNFYLHCGFSLDRPRPKDNFNLVKDAGVPKDGLAMRASSGYLVSHLSFTKLEKDVMFLDLNPYMFDKMKYIKDKKALKVYNIHFKWRTVKPEQLEGVAKLDITWCEKNPGIERSLRSGLCKQSVKDITGPAGVDPIPNIFQGWNATSGDCVWKAAALLIHKRSLFDAMTMMDLLGKYKSEFK